MDKGRQIEKIERVIIVSNSCSVGGGASKIALQTARTLSSLSDWEVWLFCGLSDPASERSLKQCGVHVASLHHKPYLQRKERVASAFAGLYDVEAERALRRLLLQGNPRTTVVHFHSWLHTLSPSLFYAAAKCKARVCVTAHEYFSICPNGGLFDYRRLEKCKRRALSPGCLLCNCDKRSYAQKLYRCLRYAIQLRGLKRSHASFFAISETNRRLLEEHSVPGGVRGMLLNPIDTPEGDAVPCGLEKDSFFLYVGRLDPEKGVPLLCEAARKAGVKLVVVGDGPLMGELKRSYPEVRFEGWKGFREIAGYYEAARAVVIPSLWYEGAPLAAFEARAYSSGPLVAPNQCSASECIENGVDGIVFKSGDVGSLASALSTLKDDRTLREMRERGGAPNGRTLQEYVEGLRRAYETC